MIRVLVVDDQELIRDLIGSALRAAHGIDVIGICVDGQDALDFVAETRPDVVLMDLSMPRMDGVEATRRLLADDPSVRVVIFTVAVHSRQTKAALEFGAVSCVGKGAHPTEVVRAVRAAVLTR